MYRKSIQMLEPPNLEEYNMNQYQTKIKSIRSHPELFTFVVLRHVTNSVVNLYWQMCLQQLKQNYPKCQVVVIDDHSPWKPEFTILNPQDYTQVRFYDSDIEPKRGELLPYYYSLKYKFNETMIIIHDTLFFHETIDFEQPQNYQTLWCFHNDKTYLESNLDDILVNLDHSKELRHIYNSISIRGSLGAMTIINFDFLQEVFTNNRWMNQLVSLIDSRLNRMKFERLLPLLFYHHTSKLRVSFFGDHIKYFDAIYNHIWDHYLQRKSRLPVELIWTGRG